VADSKAAALETSIGSRWRSRRKNRRALHFAPPLADQLNSGDS
jgi:hypothetical protein